MPGHGGGGAACPEIQFSRAALCLSGGVDSAVLAALLAESSVEFHVTGLPGSRDFDSARSAAERVGRSVVEHPFRVDELPGAIVQVGRLADTEHPMVISFLIPFYFLARDLPGVLLVTGHGADELFGGYNRHLRVSREALGNILKMDVENLSVGDGVRLQRVAEGFGCPVLLPYMDKRVIDAGLSLPPEMLVHGGERKIVLRQLGSKLGLGELASRPKKATQFSTGVKKAMGRLARAEGLDVDSYVQRLLEG